VWRLSNTLDADLCVETLEEALRKGKPDVFNPDRGSQFTSRLLLGFWSNTELRSAWMVKVVTDITCLSKGYGGQ
jgi:hypothetical protein